MSRKFTKQVLKIVVAQMCQTIGWHSIQTTPLEILIDVLHRYLDEVARTTHLYADQFGRTIPNLDDLGLAFSEMGISVKELEEYVQFVESVPPNVQVPKFPVPKESHLNFLKPGSKEVVTRPVHVHEHLPPTILEEYAPLAVDTGPGPSTPSPQASPQAVFKRPGDPVESPAVKRARLVLEEEGRPLREISSVMMTTGGFLSPAREGKLPEAKVVLPSSDSRSESPQPPSYPSVPPEVNREKKTKKTSDGTKVEKEKKKEKSKVEKIQSTEDSTKKLASMKEMAKLKALKAGAMKLAPLIRPGSNKLIPQDVIPEKSLIQKLSESPHLVVTPVQPIMKRPSPPTYDRLKDPGMTIAKLSAEPDRQKLNIFKKISAKVKEEKVEKHEVTEPPPQPPPPPPIIKERSPGLVIEEVITKRPRSALNELIDMMPKQIKDRPRTPDIVPIYDNDLSSPGSPSTPKTPEILHKSPDHKKKRRDKEKKKKKHVPKEKKHEEIEIERPKTPEIIEIHRPRETLSTPVFPFFPHFPPAPGLIPPPISNPLFPRYPLPLGANFPHPAMPNLPLPPPLFMQQSIKQEKKEKTEKLFEKPGPSISPKPSEKEGKSPLSMLLNRDKTSEKKAKDKEHKKDKKDKIKKKKDKKEKVKNKEKGEKKKKEDKHKEHKTKEKKEKREKKKDKVLVEEKQEISVPKLMLKLGPASPRPPSPAPEPKSKKVVMKGMSKEEEAKPIVEETKREPSPEIARISSLFNKPAVEPKQPVTKMLHVQTELTKTAPAVKSPGTIIDKDGNKVWICPACGRPDDGTPMIGCDECDAWYHWVCVGIQVPPDENVDWYCRFCIVKKQGTQPEKKKRGRKKKPPV